MWGEPASESEDDATAAENYIQFTVSYGKILKFITNFFL